MSVQSAQVFVSEYAKNIRMYHPNFHEIIGQVTNFYAPTGYKKRITSNA